MKIGSVELGNQVVAAPMAGVTDRAFRILAREHGCGLVFTEMVSDQALLHASPRTERMLDFRNEFGPIGVQIFGSNIEYMGRAAVLAAERGAAIIDINMGCPTPKIVRNGEGAALMKQPELAAAIVKEVVRQAGSIPVTVKMRKGWDEGSVNAVELARLVVAAGAKAVTVHGRTRNQFYSGKADWNIIRQVKEAVATPVIGNGDIQQPVDARRMLEETGCDAVMIGRAAMGNPWIFQRTVHFLVTGEIIPEPPAYIKIQTARRHLQLLMESKGEYLAVREMRKHASWYMKGLPGAARAREQANKAESALEIDAVMSELLIPAAGQTY
ncbi:MAG: tRNA dihydrouridine synthase DusB [Bacillota bacterium]